MKTIQFKDEIGDFTLALTLTRSAKDSKNLQFTEFFWSDVLKEWIASKDIQFKSLFSFYNDLELYTGYKPEDVNVKIIN